MARSKEASVKLTLSSSGFLSAMRTVTAHVQKAGKQMGAALAAAGKEGFGAMKKEMAGMGNELKSTIKQVATLGGALSGAALVKGAIGLQSQFKDIAFAAKAGGRATLNWRVELEHAQRVAMTTGQTTEALGRTFQALYAGVGDVDFARAALEPIGVTASATGASLEALASIAAALNGQFGVTAEELPDAMASVISLANQGGLSIDQMGTKLSELGAVARQAGFEGIEGFREVVAMTNAAVTSAGTAQKAFAAVAGVLDSLRSDDVRKKIRVATRFQVDTRDRQGMQRDATEVLADIFKATGAKKEKLQAIFTGDQLKLVTDLGNTYRQTFEQTSGTIKERTEAATKAFRTALESSGKAAIDYADLQAEAANRSADPQARLAEAVERVSIAFTKPEMLDAITRLSDSLPTLADGLGTAARFAAESPKLAIAAIIGLRTGSAFANVALTELAKKAWEASKKLGSKPGGGGEGGGGDGTSPAGAAGGRGKWATVGAATTGFLAGFTVGELIVQKLIQPGERGADKGAEFAVLTSMNVDTAVRGLESGRVSPEAAQKLLADMDREIEQARLNSGLGDYVSSLLGVTSLEQYWRNAEIARRAMPGVPGSDLAESRDRLEAAIGAARDREAATASDIGKAVASELTGKTINVNIVGGGASPSGGTPSRGPMPSTPTRPGYR